MSSASLMLVKRDRLILAASLTTITLLAWAYTIYLARDMQGMDMTMPTMQAWNTVDILLTFIMWTVMMVAMMTPSASPMVFLFARVDSQRRKRGFALPLTWLFLSGYLAVWTGFSLLATLMQWGLHSAALALPDDGQHEPGTGWTVACDHRPLSVYACQACLFGRVSLTARLSHVAMAIRSTRRFRHGLERTVSSAPAAVGH